MQKPGVLCVCTCVYAHAYSRPFSHHHAPNIYLHTVHLAVIHGSTSRHTCMALHARTFVHAEQAACLAADSGG